MGKRFVRIVIKNTLKSNKIVKTIDSSGTAGYDTSPIVAGKNSFEIFLRGHWTGSFNRVDNVQMWQDTDFSPNTGLSVYWDGATVDYSQPVTATSSIATAAIPTADPETANVSIGGALTGALTSAGYSDFVVMQLRTTTAASPGDTSLSQQTVQFDES